MNEAVAPAIQDPPPHEPYQRKRISADKEAAILSVMMTGYNINSIAYLIQ